MADTVLDSPRRLAGLRRRLLGWYDAHRRDLPWRRDRDPYRIWVSEVMLQQTQVATVKPYFERFMAAFPTLADLATADLDAVLRHWAGLGYYRRARHLHAAAIELHRQYAGTLPDDPDVWRRLPGVGRYILGAVLSQAFDRRLPIVEANTIRVLTRLLGERGDPATNAVQRRLWHAAETLLPTKRVGDFNQALMELGSLVCTIERPACQQCPLARDCLAHRHGAQDQIPQRSPPPPLVAVSEVAVVVQRQDRVLLVQRPPTAKRWAQLWEFPHDPIQPGESSEAAAVRLVEAMTGLRIAAAQPWTTIRHQVTRHAITMQVLRADWVAGEFVAGTAYAAGRWLRADELGQFALSSPQRRLARLLQSSQLSLFAVQEDADDSTQTNANDSTQANADDSAQANAAEV